MLVFKSLPLKNYHIEVVLCLKGSDDDDVHKHLVISNLVSIRI